MLMKNSKQAYCNKCFETNWNNIKNTWKGIKSNFSNIPVASSVLTALSLDNGDTISSPYDIANTSNNYFASIAETMQKPCNVHIHIVQTILQTKVAVYLFKHK